MDEPRCNSPAQYYDYKNESETPAYYNNLQIDDGKWTREQTQVLIETWKKQKSILLNAASSSAEHFKVWKMIAIEVNKYQPPKTLQQCKKKFRNIRYICKTAITNNSDSGNKKHFPLFYTDFVEIISESERVKEYQKRYTPPLDNGADNASDTSSEYHNNEDKFYSTETNINTKHFIGEQCSNKTEAENNDSLPSFVDINSHNKSSCRIKTSPCRANTSNYLDKNKNNDDNIVEYNNVEGFNRKHKTDVSIMGKNYLSHKRHKNSDDIFDSESTSLKTNLRKENLHQANFDEEPYFKKKILSTSFLPVEKQNATFSVKSPVPNSTIRENTKELFSNGYLKNYGNTSIFTSSQPQPRNLFNIDERFLELQEKQMQVFSNMLERHEQFLLQLLQQQREAATEAQTRDREFMLNLVEMFVSKKKTN
ncbi:uncharacterized protein LOC136076935 [Hydra vulgaris]|uniref:Uncharacterized protein LOC136076935 n=1 Tax=Hydra vulgaris TaxID=6087 RepID=A0ABM4BDC9_HYDVU